MRQIKIANKTKLTIVVNKNAEKKGKMQKKH